MTKLFKAQQGPVKESACGESLFQIAAKPAQKLRKKAAEGRIEIECHWIYVY